MIVATLTARNSPAIGHADRGCHDSRFIAPGHAVCASAATAENASSTQMNHAGPAPPSSTVKKRARKLPWLAASLSSHDG